MFWLWSRLYLQENKHPFWKFLASWPSSSKKNVIIIIVFFLLDICHEAENVQKEVIIVIVFFLLDKGHKAENLQNFLLYYHFPMEDSSESYLQGQGCSSHIAKICVGTKHFTGKAKIKYKSVSSNVLKKIRVGRSEKYFILFWNCVKHKNVVHICYIVTLKVVNSSHYAWKSGN